jgi:hypothetical protein
MHTQRNAGQLEFSGVERRRIVAAFDGGRVSSDAGALLLGKLAARRTDCAALAGESTLSRLELHESEHSSRPRRSSGIWMPPMTASAFVCARLMARAGD